MFKPYFAGLTFTTFFRFNTSAKVERLINDQRLLLTQNKISRKCVCSVASGGRTGSRGMKRNSNVKDTTKY